MAGLWALTGAGWGIGRVLWVVRAFGGSAWAFRAVAPPPVPLVVCYYALIAWVALETHPGARADPPAPARRASAAGTTGG